MSSITYLLHRELHWVGHARLNPDERGYLDTVENNLFQPLSDNTRKAFEKGSGSELLDTKSRPAKMKALHSSSALVVNVFDHWAGKNTDVLAEALGLDSEIIAIKFEEQYPTGLKGNPPNLDVVLELQDGRVIGIESKFSEWLTPKTKSHVPFKSKYFPDRSALWETQALPKTQRLTETMYAGDESFRYLDAAQLLKHTLGMATQLGNRFSLQYIYYDWPGPESEMHRQEIARFSQLVDDSLEFQAMSYQELFNSMRRLDVIDERYLSYLDERYFR